MLFASDLDQTLIYSQRSMGQVSLDQLVPVERYEGRIISYMSHTSIKRLRTLMNQVEFVPVTTRTVEQYRRIFYLADLCRPKYAITSNGGHLLVDGKPDEDWAQQIRLTMRECSEALEVKARFDELAHPEWVVDVSFADEMFFAIRIHRDKLPLSEMESFRLLLADQGWKMSIQGRKLYLVPAGLCKGRALSYVAQLLGCSRLAAAGDSLLDESLLRAADFAIAPKHGELFRHYGGAAPTHFTFTEQSGLAASEELLVRIQAWFASSTNYAETTPLGIQ
ncbi:hydrolase [Paenibacillus sp. ACRRX]|uniref:HAD family hydrolase n=1 Tax=Paenibacillus sp. ACRRX TaxID=2918206 RepID=UPI001EF5DAA7|nr:HAD family hydrolase [Paenibacillus sp. ACRRX]MCG7409685.1 hydrolase [Paenibacillus sp. ACRRX]